VARRLIETDTDVAEGAAWRAAREPRFAHALALTGPPPLRRKPGGFAALVEAIVAPQVPAASAAAILARMAAGLTAPEPLVANRPQSPRVGSDRTCGVAIADSPGEAPTWLGA
jgi:DNA-3-methyladenine glycosylase II